MGKTVALFLVLAVMGLAGYAILNSDQEPDISSNTVVAPDWDVSNTAGFKRAIDPYEWHFPEDYGAHPQFQTEWWYYTGNLSTSSGRRFGYEFTIFRRALTSTAPESGSEWRTNQAYMAHFTITNVENQQFYQSQRFSRGGAGLAGAEVDPVYHVWLDEWQVLASDPEAANTVLTASTNDVAIVLNLQQTKPPALQGDHGLDQKSAEPGNASYYYSLTRLQTTGEITINGEVYTVTGSSWKDHEFSTRAMTMDMAGWDWFGLQLDDNRELMLGQIRSVDGQATDLGYGGLLVLSDGSTQRLERDDFSIEVTETWASPHTGAVYPARWEISLDLGNAEPLHITLIPLMPDQELTEGIVYWEGAVQIMGDVTGYGYVELTGYALPMQTLF
jgi:predicted secreted hydrolase